MPLKIVVSRKRLGTFGTLEQILWREGWVVRFAMALQFPRAAEAMTADVASMRELGVWLMRLHVFGQLALLHEGFVP